MNHQTVLIVGFTKRTSFAAAIALLSRGNTILVSDSTSDEEKRNLLSELQPLGTVIDLLGKQSPDILETYRPSLVLPSPGVPLTIPLIQKAIKMKIPVMGDIELFYQYHSDPYYIAITGTDGKTTTTSLTHAIVQTERQALAGGNIGIPIFEYDSIVNKESVMVLELSSFQLEAVDRFKPNAAAVLNIAEDHLDRYGSVESYMLAKKNIFRNQSKDNVAVLNYDNPYTPSLMKGIQSQVQMFSLNSNKADIYYQDQTVYYQGKAYLHRQDIRLKGIHNVENAMAAILLTKAAGISDSSIRKALSAFEGLEHRLEFVRSLNGVDYYNDSKSTTVNSLEKALMSFDQRVILIAGGRDKGLDFTKIKELASNKLKKLILIGEASGKIKNELGFSPNYFAKDMEDAVKTAEESASKGDAVLLSPGCASFDMFKNYETRGKVFKDLVKKL